MSDNTASIKDFMAETKDLSKTQIELLELYAIEKIASILSILAVRILIFMMVVLSALIVTMGIAVWTGEMLGRYFYGFFIMGGVYIFASVVLYIFRDQWIKVPIYNFIILQLTKK